MRTRGTRPGGVDRDLPSQGAEGRGESAAKRTCHPLRDRPGVPAAPARIRRRGAPGRYGPNRGAPAFAVRFSLSAARRPPDLDSRGEGKAVGERRLEREFRQVVGESVELLTEGADRFRVLTPFGFDDGDCFVVVLRRQEGRWFLTDEGHPFFHRSDEFEESDLRSGSGARRIAAVPARFGVEDRGELPAGDTGTPLRGGASGLRRGHRGHRGHRGRRGHRGGRGDRRSVVGAVPGCPPRGHRRIGSRARARGQAGPRAGSPGREFGREFAGSSQGVRGGSCPTGFSRARRAASARRREGGGGFGSPCRGDRRSARAPSAPGSEIWVDHIH